MAAVKNFRGTSCRATRGSGKTLPDAARQIVGLERHMGANFNLILAVPSRPSSALRGPVSRDGASKLNGNSLAPPGGASSRLSRGAHFCATLAIPGVAGRFPKGGETYPKGSAKRAHRGLQAFRTDRESPGRPAQILWGLNWRALVCITYRLPPPPMILGGRSLQSGLCLADLLLRLLPCRNFSGSPVSPLEDLSTTL